jgi:hypothetical protein
MEFDEDDRDRRLARFSPLEIAGTVIVGIGVVLGAVGVGYVVQGNKARQRLDEAIASGEPQARVEPLQDISRANDNLVIFFAASGATVAVGSVVYFTGRSMRRKRSSRAMAALPTPVPVPSGAAVSWSLRF